MSLTLATITTRLQTLLRDGGNSKWTASEKSEAVTQAINDPVLSDRVSDETVASSTATQSYTIPATIDRLIDLYIIDSSGIRYRVNPADYEQENDELHFRQYPSLNGTFEMIGVKKYASTDTIPDEFAQFVLYRAARVLYEILIHEYASGILLSDITLAEIQNSISYFARMETQERSRLQRFTNTKGMKI